MFQLRSSHLICLILIYQRSVSASYEYAGLPNVFNSLPNGIAYATPLPCDLPPPPLQGYGAAAYAKPLVFASYPHIYAPTPQYNYASVAPSFAKAEPRIKVSTGLPVTTTYTTAVGLAAPPPVVGFAPAPSPAIYGVPPTGYSGSVSYAAPPTFIGSTAYATPTVLAAASHVKKFRAPLPVTGYAYAQGAAW
ncbi:uncharacterized protein LOC129242677 [Anastrepha obliqua]|uniref:uncharacterized protein LOC129242677 n=1 Tax=Anastrepha obliqua TaxID=95512 RepID=UPI0024099E7F|nr:uncharacterized protein LOC129242677 [Anastrepha obliqua]